MCEVCWSSERLQPERRGQGPLRRVVFLVRIEVSHPPFRRVSGGMANCSLKFTTLKAFDASCAARGGADAASCAAAPVAILTCRGQCSCSPAAWLPPNASLRRLTPPVGGINCGKSVCPYGLHANH